MAESEPAANTNKFTPKDPPKLEPPRDETISVADLAKCDGTDPKYPTYVAVMGTIFDVSGNSSYAPKGSYCVFAGKDASRALAQSSLKLEDCVPEWEDLPEKEKGVLKDWHTFFSKRYNIVGKVQP
ncbi:hypothetical protein MMC21_001392 [Puttea exsequens]|nr:hypothetical protein [Puttea exsequens]